MADIMTPTLLKELANPKLDRIAKRVVSEIMLATEKVVAHDTEPAAFPLPDQADSVERILWNRYQELGEAQHAVARAKVMPRIKASKAARSLAHQELAAVDLRSKEPVAAQAQKIAWPAGFMLSGPELEAVAQDEANADGSFSPQQTTDKLELRVLEVKCIDETNSFFAPESIGNDEIKLGGVAIDAGGATQTIPPFTVSNNFDDGETKKFSPPRRFAQFDLRKGTEFPKSFFVTFALAEIDVSGGMIGFVNKLSSAIKESVDKKLASLIGGGIGAPGGPIGAAIGSIVGVVVGKVFAQLARAFGDDEFTPATVTLRVPSLAHTFTGGSATSRPQSVDFKGHNGHYRLTFDWRVFA